MTNKKGFTIVELVIVIAVIAILAAVLIPTFSSVISKANASAAQSACKNALEIVLANESGAAIGQTDYLFKSGDYYCAYDHTSTSAGLGAASKTRPDGFKATAETYPAGSDIAADLNKLGVSVYTKAAANPSAG